MVAAQKHYESILYSDELVNSKQSFNDLAGQTSATFSSTSSSGVSICMPFETEAQAEFKSSSIELTQHSASDFNTDSKKILKFMMNELKKGNSFVFESFWIHFKIT